MDGVLAELARFSGTWRLSRNQPIQSKDVLVGGCFPARVYRVGAAGRIRNRVKASFLLLEIPLKINSSADNVSSRIGASFLLRIYTIHFIFAKIPSASAILVITIVVFCFSFCFTAAYGLSWVFQAEVHASSQISGVKRDRIF